MECIDSKNKKVQKINRHMTKDRGAERMREKGRKKGKRKEREITKNLLMTIGEIWV